jgi:hypothetical protein
MIVGDKAMSRLLLLVLALAGGGCAGRTYTIEAAANEADQRATRYCALQNATPRLEGVERRGPATVEVYRCDTGSPPATTISRVL